MTSTSNILQIFALYQWLTVLESCNDSLQLQNTATLHVMWHQWFRAKHIKMQYNVVLQKWNTVTVSLRSSWHYFDRCTHFTGLEVTFDNWSDVDLPKLGVNKHPDTVTCSKGVGGFIRTTKTFQNIAAIKLLYLTLVRSNLEYCSLIYGYKVILIIRVERRLHIWYSNLEKNIGQDVLLQRCDMIVLIHVTQLHAI